MKHPEIEQAFAKIPLLRDLRPADFSITPLAGYTNFNFRLKNERHDWVLRIPRAKTNCHIDRNAEAHNQSLAAKLGIAPEPVWRDAHGLSLTPTIVNGHALAASDIADPASLETITEPLRKLHRSGMKFEGRVVLGDLLQRYFDLLPAAKRIHFTRRLEAARLLIAALEDSDCAYVPSHNDLVLDNLLRTPERLWLIDWEFAAMASPYWDLATLCNAANLDYGQSLALLRAYCAGAGSMQESPLFDYRNLLQLLGDCWMAALVEN